MSLLLSNGCEYFQAMGFPVTWGVYAGVQVKAGQNQADWEKSGWIAAQDPRGWFHWYCRFYQVLNCCLLA